MVGNVQGSRFKIGDVVVVTKEGKQKGNSAHVVNPTWHGMVKVEMDDGPHIGGTKSYSEEHLILKNGAGEDS